MRKEFESGHITRHCESVRTKQSDEIASPLFAMTGQRGHSTPTCHPWTSVSEIHASKKGNCPVDNLIWGAMRHNESKWGTQDELMSELKSILPLKNKGSQRGFAQNPSCTFPYVLREGQIGRSTPTCHPWTSVSEIRGSTGRGFNAPHSTRFAQCGRSMVETLGTLAIMGILGVAGMAAYNSAMNRYRANTLISEAQRRAVVVAGQIGFNNQAPNLSEFEPYNKTSAGEFGDVITEGLYKQFGIKVSKVSKSVCENILRTVGESTPIRRLSKETTPTTPITSCDNENTFLFIYNDGMTAENDTQHCSTHNDSCGENECVICDAETKTCQNKCVEVDYLESDGTQYIDTGITSNNNIKVQTKIHPTAINRFIFGSRFLATTNAFGLYMHPDNGGSWYPFFGNGKSMIPGFAINNDYTIEFSKDGLIVNGTLLQGPYDTTFTNALTMKLFAMDTNGTPDNRMFIGKMEYCKIYDNSAIVRDFIPVLSPESSQYAGAPCMFDRVSKKLFCNAGTGDFEYGPK